MLISHELWIVIKVCFALSTKRGGEQSLKGPPYPPTCDNRVFVTDLDLRKIGYCRSLSASGCVTRNFSYHAICVYPCTPSFFAWNGINAGNCAPSQSFGRNQFASMGPDFPLSYPLDPISVSLGLAGSLDTKSDAAKHDRRQCSSVVLLQVAWDVDFETTSRRLIFHFWSISNHIFNCTSLLWVGAAWWSFLRFTISSRQASGSLTITCKGFVCPQAVQQGTYPWSSSNVCFRRLAVLWGCQRPGWWTSASPVYSSCASRGWKSDMNTLLCYGLNLCLGWDFRKNQLSKAWQLRRL